MEKFPTFKRRFEKTYLDGRKIDAFVQVGFYYDPKGANDYWNGFEYYSGFSRRANVADASIPENISVQFGIVVSNVENIENVLNRIENEIFRAFSDKETVLEFKEFKKVILQKWK